MKKIISFFIILLLYQISAQSQTPIAAVAVPQGQVREGLHFKSDILGRDVNYCVYLPPDYDQSTRRYPVVYLLHGFSDNETAWVQFGEVNLAADRAIADREIPPMIVVMPDAKITWYINDYRGKDRYEDMFVEEFIPYIDKTFRTRAKKEFRGISGLSMGGYGSLMYAMRHPEQFAACAALSAGVMTDEEIITMENKQYENLFTNLFGNGLRGKNRLNTYWRSYNPLDLVKTLPIEKLKSVRWYMDCGDDDFLYKGNSALHLLMRDLGIPHEYRVRDGAHNWTYWRTGITAALQFIGKSFQR